MCHGPDHHCLLHIMRMRVSLLLETLCAMHGPSLLQSCFMPLTYLLTPLHVTFCFIPHFFPVYNYIAHARAGPTNMNFFFWVTMVAHKSATPVLGLTIFADAKNPPLVASSISNQDNRAAVECACACRPHAAQALLCYSFSPDFTNYAQLFPHYARC